MYVVLLTDFQCSDQFSSVAVLWITLLRFSFQSTKGIFSCTWFFYQGIVSTLSFKVYDLCMSQQFSFQRRKIRYVSNDTIYFILNQIFFALRLSSLNIYLKHLVVPLQWKKKNWCHAQKIFQSEFVENTSLQAQNVPWLHLAGTPVTFLWPFCSLRLRYLCAMLQLSIFPWYYSKDHIESFTFASFSSSGCLYLFPEPSPRTAARTFATSWKKSAFRCRPADERPPMSPSSRP